MTRWTIILISTAVLVSTIAHGQTVTPEYKNFIKKGDSLLNAKNKNAPYSYSAAFKTIGWRIIPTGNYTNDCYNAARAWTMAHKSDSAFFYLDRIINKLSFTDLDKLVNDSAFISLRNDKRWKPLTESIVVLKSSFEKPTISNKVDIHLYLQLDSLRTIDQKWRNLLTKIGNHEVDTISADKAVRQMVRTDSLNFIQIKKLFDKHGFLGYDKVGTDGSNIFWLLVQHSDKHPIFQDSVLTKMKVEADRGNASLIDYAYLVDRVKVNTKQLQIYGTQMILNATKTSFEPRPTVEPEKLNERRKLVGLNTIEEYIQTMNQRHYGELQKNR